MNQKLTVLSAHLCRHALRLLLPLLAVALLLGACSKDKDEMDEEPPQEQPTAGTAEGRTVLVYMAAENSLATYASADVNEILQGAEYMGAKDHVLVYLDNTGKPCIYDITFWQKGKKLSELTPVLEYDTNLDSCTPETFSGVLDFVQQNYAAPSYGVVFWSHGSGWLPPQLVTAGDYSQAWGARRRAFGFDNQQNKEVNGGNQLTINQLRDVLLQHGTFDFILFDACFMQNIEVAYQLRSCARYIIGSPAEIPALGAPYDTMLKPMFQDTDYIPGMVQTYYEAYLGDPLYGVLLSAVDCSRLEAVAQLTRPFVQQYKQTLLEMDYTDVLDYYNWDSFPFYGYSDYYDMQGLLRAVLSEDDYQQWQPQYQKLFAAQAHTAHWYSAFNNRADNAVIDAQYSGISMHVPLYKYAARNKWFAPAYYETDWAKAVWNETPTE